MIVVATYEGCKFVDILVDDKFSMREALLSLNLIGEQISTYLRDSAKVKMLDDWNQKVVHSLNLCNYLPNISQII